MQKCRKPLGATWMDGKLSQYNSTMFQKVSRINLKSCQSQYNSVKQSWKIMQTLFRSYFYVPYVSLWEHCHFVLCAGPWAHVHFVIGPLSVPSDAVSSNKQPRVRMSRILRSLGHVFGRRCGLNEPKERGPCHRPRLFFFLHITRTEPRQTSVRGELIQDEDNIWASLTIYFNLAVIYWQNLDQIFSDFIDENLVD